ncbi:MAG TPA: S8 family serine peptidase [Nocardioides sp.]
MSARTALLAPARWCAAAGLLVAALVAAGPAPASHAEPGTALYLVTLRDPGTAAYAGLVTAQPTPKARRLSVYAAQDALLDSVGAPAPTYRWTTALDGVAVRLTSAQARELAARPEVALVERNAVRRLSGRSTISAVTSPPSRDAHTSGGSGVVVGIVDSGLDRDNPLFATVPGLGSVPRDFDGPCQIGPGFGECGGKVVGARWFVDGFGVNRLRAASALSPRDDSGHGTLVASVAAGNDGVSVRVGGQRLGVYSGVAPQARVAVYKACWTAPDPDDDGCSTADLVTAIDRATADGVDVLNLAASGGTLLDTVDRALMGAAQSGIFVTAAAGNNGHRRYAAHASPWVTTVGALAAPVAGGSLDVGDYTLSGAMASRRSVTARLVSSSDAAAPDASARAARLCLPGSLDAGLVAGRIVMCDRGGIGRVDKSTTVALADGVGMVLANTGKGELHADFQRVPTIHVTRTDADALRAWLRDHPDHAVTLQPGSDVGGPARVPGWSAGGDPRGGLVKPDVTALGVDVLGGVPPALGSGDRWDRFSGTSAAGARVSGQAARVLARHRDWSPAEVRSALVTSARRLGDESSLRQGGGRSRADAALRPGLVYELGATDYREYAAGNLHARDLNLPSIKISSTGPGSAVTHRTVTSVGRRAMYYSVRVRGFDRHEVRVTPAAIRIGPGERRTFTVVVTGPADRRVDSGWVTWVGANDVRVRIPLVISD